MYLNHISIIRRLNQSGQLTLGNKAKLFVFKKALLGVYCSDWFGSDYVYPFLIPLKSAV